MMNRLSRSQKEDVKQFRTVTGATEKMATEYLRSDSWNLQRAIDNYYNNPPARPAPKTDKRTVERLWQKYKDPSCDLMRAEGVSQFIDDLGVDPTDVALLVMSYHMNATHMSEFSKDEFVGGLCKLGCDTIDKLKRRLPELRVELEDDATFRKVYEYAYMFARKRGTKIVEQPMAVALWGLLFQGPKAWEMLEDWCEFLQKHHNRPILKDTWMMLLDFVSTVESDFSNYDPIADAWPPLIDEFVEHMCNERGQPYPMETE